MQINDECSIHAEITDENIFTLCPMCGREGGVGVTGGVTGRVTGSFGLLKKAGENFNQISLAAPRFHAQVEISLKAFAQLFSKSAFPA